MAAATRIDAQNPWPWLDAFDEASASFFNGRGNDIAALQRAVSALPAAVLYGKSGLGKTSLLQAGLFPLLRRQRLLPVAVRLDYAQGAAPLGEQLWRRFVEECARFGFSHRPRDLQAEDLWTWLHHRPLDLTAPDGSQWQPLFVLDPFEDVFTLGASVPEWQRRCLHDLGDLLENRVPRPVAERLRDDDAPFDSIDLDTQPYRFLLSLREDYLPDLEPWSDLMPRLGPNRVRLLPMTHSQALEAVRITGGELVSQDDATRIVGYLGRGLDESEQATSRQRARRALEIEPALLSLVCAGLNAERQKAGAPRLDTANLEQRGHRIIERFYDEALGTMPAAVREFVEERLVTAERSAHAVSAPLRARRRAARRATARSPGQRAPAAHRILCRRRPYRARARPARRHRASPPARVCGAGQGDRRAATAPTVACAGRQPVCRRRDRGSHPLQVLAQRRGTKVNHHQGLRHLGDKQLPAPVRGGRPVARQAARQGPGRRVGQFGPGR